MMIKKICIAIASLALSAFLLAGCSEDQAKKQEKKAVTTQEQMGKDAAAALKKPVEEAKKTAAEVSSKADQALKEVAGEAKKAAQEAGISPNPAGGQTKKKLEGC